MTTVEFSQAGKGESMLGICWPLSGDWVALREQKALPQCSQGRSKLWAHRMAAVDGLSVLEMLADFFFFYYFYSFYIPTTVPQPFPPPCSPSLLREGNAFCGELTKPGISS